MSEPEPTPEPTPTPTPEPTPSPEPAQSWMEPLGFDADLRSNPTLNKYETAEAQARAHIELQKTLGADRIALPGKDAKPEEWDAVFNQLGRPETSAGYELTNWEPPEGVPWDIDVTTKMVEKMHEHRLTKAQAQGVLNDYAAVQAEVWREHVANVQEQNEQTRADLQSKWGAAFATKMENGKKAALALVGKAGLTENPFEMELPDGRKVGDLPGVIELIATLGELIAEDGGPGPGMRRTTHTPDEAQRKLNEMLGDSAKVKILSDVSHPEHKALQALKTDLERQIYT